MIKISHERIKETIAKLFIDANCKIRAEVFDAWVNAMEGEDAGSPSKGLFEVMIKNAFIAWRDMIPICQDTGQPVVFIEQGEGVRIDGGSVTDAINAGIEEGGREGYLRRSVSDDPLDRDNAGAYGPAIIHHSFVPGDEIKITLYPAGCGCEQMNRVVMFPPYDMEKTIMDFVINRVKEAGSKPCPPNIIGLGIGGDLEKCAYLARKALIRPFNIRNPKYKGLENRIYQEINKLGIGAHGLGGKTTCLALNIESAPCHRGNLPLAIAFNCHIGRRVERTLGAKDELPESERGGERDREGSLFERLRDMAEGITLFKGWPRIQLPLNEDSVLSLNTGDRVLLNGYVYTARDAAHRRLTDLIKQGRGLPIPLKGEVIYYVGPTPPKPGDVTGSAGPTTSARMDNYTPLLLANGLKGMIGKGYRGRDATDSLIRHRAIYFITFAGAGALLSKHIIKSEVTAFADLGTEAIRRFELKDFPVIVACDAKGRDIYKPRS